jgi:DNA-binding CsgD family transcriptional regulator
MMGTDRMKDRRSALNRTAFILGLVVILQLFAAVFFLGDAAGDVAQDGLGPHLATEVSAVLALFSGILFGAWHVRTLVLRARADEAQVAAARGVLGELMRLRFAEWRLTPAEADVTLFALKGCDIADIATFRGSAEGTVRAQLTKVYGKAGVHNQSSLIALFIDELIDPALHARTANTGEGVRSGRKRRQAG